MHDWKNSSKTWGELKGAGTARGSAHSTQSRHLLYGLHTAHPLKADDGA